MRRMISVPLILAAAAACLSMPVQGLPGLWAGETAGIMTITAGAAPVWEYDYGTAPSGDL